MKNKVMNGKYLITTDNWFIAPDGKNYKAVYGEVKVLEDAVLGVKTNRNASNWYAKVGTENNHIIIAGCQIHYAVRTDEKPNTENVSEDNVHDGKSVISERPSRIYIFD